MIKIILEQLIIHPLYFIYGLFRSFFLTQKEMKDPIDFVVTWVDGSDKQWLSEKAKYSDRPNEDMENTNGEERYRNWDLFKYWFRAVENYATWVNKIYFVTYGHIPQWLNINAEKLVIVKHSDYMNDNYLPTFSSIPIELSFHKIKGLKEHFVYFNDDVFLNRPVTPEDFFSGGLPKICAIASPVVPDSFNNVFPHQIFSVCGLMNRIDWNKAIKMNSHKWFSYKIGIKLRYNWETFQHRYLLGFYHRHLSCSFRKSTLEKVWNKYFKELNEVSTHKFRTPMDINHLIFTLQEIADGTYYPVGHDNGGMFYGRISNEINEIVDAVMLEKYRSICINDDKDVNSNNFSSLKSILIDAFDNKFPHKSKFEK